jgi:hypothetical protein
MLSGIPSQNGESVTDLTPSPCSTQSDITCTGSSEIVIPGIGVGHLIVRQLPLTPSYLQGVT